MTYRERNSRLRRPSSCIATTVLENAMGKTVLPVTAEAPPEDAEDEDEEE
jgi:hypothetical protein